MDPRKLDKRQLLDLLRTRLEEDLQNVTSSQTAAQEGATHPESRQEDPKDTRAIEGMYLARGLAERVESMRDAVARCRQLQMATFAEDDPIANTALIGVEDDDGTIEVYFMMPFAAGETIRSEGVEVRTLTPQSPLGRVLVGKRTDDEFELDLPGGRRRGVVAWVR